MRLIIQDYNSCMFSRLRTRLTFRHVAHKEGEAILDVSGLTVRYNGTPALQDVEFRLQQGERVAVVGPNGAGKSTLFKVIAGIQEAAGGEVRIFGHEPGSHICIAYVPQRSQVDLNFPATVMDVVMMGRVGKIGLLRWPRKRDWEQVHTALDLVGMYDKADRQIGELSGGQQQRVFIAQALAQEADLILMDEPLTGLDTPSQDQIMEILDVLRDRRITVLIATHDLQQALTRYDRVLLLNRHVVAFDVPDIALRPEHLLAAYGGHLHVIRDTSGDLLVIEDKCHNC